MLCLNQTYIYLENIYANEFTHKNNPIRINVIKENHHYSYIYKKKQNKIEQKEQEQRTRLKCNSSIINSCILKLEMIFSLHNNTYSPINKQNKWAHPFNNI